jgi:hypothetical protein
MKAQSSYANMRKQKTNNRMKQSKTTSAINPSILNKKTNLPTQEPQTKDQQLPKKNLV